MASAQNERITEMENIALMECNDLEFLSEEYQMRRHKLLGITK